MKLLHLISGPRNISTALMYSFAQRSDTRVIDEPFYAYYLHTSGADHPGREEVLASQPRDANQVFEQLNHFSGPEANLFIKNMAHHLERIDLAYVLPLTNILLIRNPGQILASYNEVRKNPTLEDIGLKKQFEIYQYLIEKKNIPIILDPNEVLKNPERALNKVCDHLSIPFEKTMLSWLAGPRAEDGVWAKYWYANVHRSTGFSKQETSSRMLAPHLQKAYEDSMPYFEELSKHTLKF